MSNLIARRGMMARSQGGGGDLSDYVQDGLAFHLDGINKGAIPDSWTDLIGGVQFVNHGAVAGADHWDFDRSGIYMKCKQFAGYSPIECTMELVINIVNSNTNQKVFITNAANSFAFGWTNAKYAVGATRSVMAQFVDWDVPNGNLCLSYYKSGTKMYFCESGTLKNTTAGGDFWGIGGSETATISDYTRPFIGKVYAVRFYNRLLTNEEMIANQKVDNIRFKLGLNI